VVPQPDTIGPLAVCLDGVPIAKQIESGGRQRAGYYDSRLRRGD